MTRTQETRDAGRGTAGKQGVTVGKVDSEARRAMVAAHRLIQIFVGLSGLFLSFISVPPCRLLIRRDTLDVEACHVVFLTQQTRHRQ